VWKGPQLYMSIQAKAICKVIAAVMKPRGFAKYNLIFICGEQEYIFSKDQFPFS